MTISFLLVFLSILCFLGIAVLLVLFCYEAAKQKKQATFVKEGTMEFVMAGGRCIRVLENIKECYYHEGERTYITKFGDPDTVTPAVKDADGKITTPAKWKLKDVPVTIREAIIKGDLDSNYSSLGAWLRNKWGFFWVSLFYPAR